MFWKLKYKTFLIKGLNFYLTKKKHITINNLNNYLGYRLNTNYILNLNEIIFWTYILIFFLQNALRKNARVLFATKFELQQKVFTTVIKNSRLQFQLLKVFTKWVGGCLSNFLAVRWFYFFNRIKFYKQCPDILIVLEKKAMNPLISEAYGLNIPVVSYTNFTRSDTEVSYLLFGGNLGLEYKKNNFFFYIYILKNMLSLESVLKKKKLIKLNTAHKNRGNVRKKAFIRVKKNKAYRLFSSRGFNLWRSHFRFTVKLKLLQFKFRLIGKLLLRNFKMNKHFFKKKSTLSYIKKLKSRTYSIKSRKNLRFFYIIERRLLVVLARLYIVRVVAQDQLRFLIVNGYISIDNEIIKNPYYLIQHKSIIRVVKSIPRILSRVPKVLLTNNLRWLFYKRCRRYTKKKFWQLASRRRFWARPKFRLFRFKKKIGKKKKLIRTQKRFLSRKRPIPIRYIMEPYRYLSKNIKIIEFTKKKVKRRFLIGEPRRRHRRFKWIGLNKKASKPIFPFLLTSLPQRLLSGLNYSRITKNKMPETFLIKDNSKKWFTFFKTPEKKIFSLVIQKKSQLIIFPKNKYSCVLKLLKKKLRRKRILEKRKFKEYVHSIFFKRLGFNLINLPFSRKKIRKQRIALNRLFAYRRGQKKIRFRNRRFFKVKKKKRSFFFLKFRKKRFKRRSPKSLRRKFFTNIWLVAFIFTSPIRIKKLWYSKLVTRRVLSFFCTNFW